MELAVGQDDRMCLFGGLSPSTETGNASRWFIDNSVLLDTTRIETDIETEAVVIDCQSCNVTSVFALLNQTELKGRAAIDWVDHHSQK